MSETDGRNIIKIYLEGSKKKLDIEIVTQCAPLILGKKISNILITEEENRKEAESIFHYAGFATYLLYQGNGKATILVYNKEIFWKYLEKEECNQFLEECGYHQKGKNAAVEIFCKLAPRFSNYMKTKQKFPHELGILLGYPVKDVKGFIKNNGKNFLYSGYWKVYSDLQNALNTFEYYEWAKSILVKMLLEGFSIQKILGIWSVKKEVQMIR